MKSLYVFPLIGFCSLVSAPTGWGAIIYAGDREIPIPTTFTGIYLDLTNGNTHTSDPLGFSEAQINFFFGGLGIASDEDFLPARVGTGNLDPIQLLMPGDQVDATLSFGPVGNGGSDGHVASPPGPNQFESGLPGFIGFQLDLNQNDQFVYGWMRATLTNGSSEGVVHEWAFSDTPGEPVVVGVIPEPLPVVFFGPALVLALGFRQRKWVTG